MADGTINNANSNAKLYCVKYAPGESTFNCGKAASQIMFIAFQNADFICIAGFSTVATVLLGTLPSGATVTYNNGVWTVNNPKSWNATAYHIFQI